eukprot:gene4662-3677_t
MEVRCPVCEALFDNEGTLQRHLEGCLQRKKIADERDASRKNPRRSRRGGGTDSVEAEPLLELKPSSSLQRESEDAGQGLERPNTRPETTTSPPQPAPAPASAGAAPSAALTLEPCAHVQDPSDWFVVPKQTASVDGGSAGAAGSLLSASTSVPRNVPILKSAFSNIFNNFFLAPGRNANANAAPAYIEPLPPPPPLQDPPPNVGTKAVSSPPSKSPTTTSTGQPTSSSQKPCKCGSMAHKRSSFKDCPLNPARLRASGDTPPSKASAPAALDNGPVPTTPAPSLAAVGQEPGGSVNVSTNGGVGHEAKKLREEADATASANLNANAVSLAIESNSSDDSSDGDNGNRDRERSLSSTRLTSYLPSNPNAVVMAASTYKAEAARAAEAPWRYSNVVMPDIDKAELEGWNGETRFLLPSMKPKRRKDAIMQAGQDWAAAPAVGGAGAGVGTGAGLSGVANGWSPASAAGIGFASTPNAASAAATSILGFSPSDLAALAASTSAAAPVPALGAATPLSAGSIGGRASSFSSSGSVGRHGGSRRGSASGGFTKSGYVGVRILESGRFSANIQHERRNVHCGTFDTSIEAAVAYDKKLRTLPNRAHKVFNFPLPGEKKSNLVVSTSLNYMSAATPEVGVKIGGATDCMVAGVSSRAGWHAGSVAIGHGFVKQVEYNSKQFLVVRRDAFLPSTLAMDRVPVVPMVTGHDADGKPAQESGTDGVANLLAGYGDGRCNLVRTVAAQSNGGDCCHACTTQQHRADVSGGRSGGIGGGSVVRRLVPVPAPIPLTVSNAPSSSASSSSSDDDEFPVIKWTAPQAQPALSASAGAGAGVCAGVGGDGGGAVSISREGVNVAFGVDDDSQESQDIEVMDNSNGSEDEDDDRGSPFKAIAEAVLGVKLEGGQPKYKVKWTKRSGSIQNGLESWVSAEQVPLEKIEEFERQKSAKAIERDVIIVEPASSKKIARRIM